MLQCVLGDEKYLAMVFMCEHAVFSVIMLITLV